MSAHSLTDLSDIALIDGVAQKSVVATCLLIHAARDFAPAAFSTSLGAEDMVLLDLIARNDINVEVFSIDTGRLPAETYEVLAEAEKHYDRRIKVYYPRHDLVEAFVSGQGINGFYDSIDNRKACCHVRKVEPLKRALDGRRAWVTGLRAEQAATASASSRWRTTEPSTSSGESADRLERARDGPTSAPSEVPTTSCTTAATRASAARPARAPSNPARTCAPAGGGGRTPRPRSADCTWSMDN
jgi:hypothetical protein